jgi:hypothetical protein
VSTAVRATLCDLIHNRKTAWPLRRFLPGKSFASSSGRMCPALPTEKDSGPGPP